MMAQDTAANRHARAADRRVLARLAQCKGIAAAMDDWRITSLSASRPVYRVVTPAGSWIVRRAVDADKEVQVGRVFAAMAIATFEIDALGDDWLAMQDLALPTLDDYLGRGPAVLTPRLFHRLGALAIQAELVAMRDRKPGNILVDDTGPLELVMVDYEGAFAAGLADRLLRPHRYVTYLTTRLFFDVLHLGCGRTDDCDELLGHFRDGMLHEQARLNGRSVNVPLSWKQRLIVNSRITSPDRLMRLFNRGLARARRKTRTLP